MKILPYDEVDPLGVLNMNLLSLDYALTPERVALIRRLDTRPFPFFALYAVIDGVVAGQVGVYSLPMISMQGLEHVGGLCAVCTHPAFTRQGIATSLFEAAHGAMRSAGLRFSTLGTARYRIAHAAYRKSGYRDIVTAQSTFAYRDTVRLDTTLRAEQAGTERLHLADRFFAQVSRGRLGFGARDPDFIAMMVAIGDLRAVDVWLLWRKKSLVGYALASVSKDILRINDLLLEAGIDAAGAVAAMTQAADATYIQIRIQHPSVAASLHQAGYPIELPGWSTFMVKPLESSLTVEDFCGNFGIGTERFLISPIDVT